MALRPISGRANSITGISFQPRLSAFGSSAASSSGPANGKTKFCGSILRHVETVLSLEVGFGYIHRQDEPPQKATTGYPVSPQNQEQSLKITIKRELSFRPSNCQLVGLILVPIRASLGSSFAPCHPPSPPHPKKWGRDGGEEVGGEKPSFISLMSISPTLPHQNRELE